MTLALCLVLVAAVCAVATDAVWRRIPNAITIPLALAGVAVNAIHGWQASLAGLAIMAAVLIAGTALHARGVVGGGDVKFVAAAGATLNYPDALTFVLYMFIAGGIVALVASARQGRFSGTVRTVAAMGALLVAGAAPPLPASRVKFPYGLAILCGAGIVALSHTLVPSLRLLR